MARKRPTEKAWLRGYGTAMATMIRCFHSYDDVAKAMKSDGIALDDLVAAGISAKDTAYLIRACRE